MGVFRQFPYTNFHEMNLDEIIKVVKDMLEEWAEYHTTWDTWKNGIDAAIEEFYNWFNTLDVQEEINKKLTEMKNSGELAEIIQPFIPAEVTSWLADHITQPVGVVIDTSLTVEGACADAKATGDAIKNIKDDLENVNFNQWIQIDPFVNATSHIVGTARPNRSTLDCSNPNYLKAIRSSTNPTMKSYGCYFAVDETAAGANRTGHKIYIRIEGLDDNGTNDNNKKWSLIGYSNGTIQGIHSTDFTGTSYENIFTLDADMGQLYLLLKTENAVPVGEYFTLSWIQFIDLTEMFGSGYEPSIEQFKSVYDSMPYDFYLSETPLDLREFKMLLSQIMKNDNLIIPENIIKKNTINGSTGEVIYSNNYGVAYITDMVPNAIYELNIILKEDADTEGYPVGIHAFDADETWLGRIYSFSFTADVSAEINVASNVEKIAITFPFELVDVYVSGKTSVDVLAREQIRELANKSEPTLNMKKNNPLLVSEMINVAETYYNHRNDQVGGQYTMEYSVNTVLDNSFDGNGIDCSTFIGLVYRGIPYEDTAYADPDMVNDPESYVANPDYVWSINLYEHKERSEVESLVTRRVRSAAQIAEFMINQGYSVIDPKDDYVNVEPGDIVFYAEETPQGYKREYRYMHISHVALCISKTKNDDDDPYPFSHELINVVRETPCVTKIELETVWEDQIVVIVRPDLGSLSYDGQKLVLGDTTLDETQLEALLALI